MQLIPNNTKIDFLGKSRFAFVLSFLLMLGAVYIFYQSGDKKFGIDFLGGHEIVVRTASNQSAESVRDAIEKAGIKDPIVQSFEIGSNEYSIRIASDQGDTKAVKEKVESTLKDVSQDVTILKTDFVGPVVGSELKRDAIIALIAGLIGILIYVSIRFETSFAIGAVAAIFHDTIVCVGIYLLAGHTLTMGAVAAALTMVGYSVNDTIVIFDRVREEVLKQKNPNLYDIMNESVNLMLERTLITSFLTLCSALALLLVGGGAISDLSLFLVVGIITGSYSTIYIAAPVAILWEKMRSRKAQTA